MLNLAMSKAVRVDDDELGRGSVLWGGGQGVSQANRIAEVHSVYLVEEQSGLTAIAAIDETKEPWDE